TAIRPADAASEKSRSRRAGTWKEWRTSTDARRSVSGSSTDARSACGAVTERKNHTQAATAPTATTALIKAGGRARVRYEKIIPAVTSVPATSAVAAANSSNEAHAAIATRTAPAHATRSLTESSGTPGRFARRTASMTLIVRTGRHHPGSPRAPSDAPPAAGPERTG